MNIFVKAFYTLIFLFALLLSTKSTAAPNCASLFDPSIVEISNESELTKEVEIVWYPNSEYLFISHTELIVDGTLWSGLGGYTKKGSAEKIQRAANMGGKGYVSFHLKITDGELKNIRNYLQENDGKNIFQNCVSGACKAISKNSDVVIPFPIRAVPTLTAAYLTALQKLGYHRIDKIEWVGQRKLTKFLSIQPFYELWLSKIIGEAFLGLVVSGVNRAFELIQTVIPVLGSTGLGQNDSNTINLLLSRRLINYSSSNAGSQSRQSIRNTPLANTKDTRPLFVAQGSH